MRSGSRVAPTSCHHVRIPEMVTCVHRALVPRGCGGPHAIGCPARGAVLRNGMIGVPRRGMAGKSSDRMARALLEGGKDPLYVDLITLHRGQSLVSSRHQRRITQTSLREIGTGQACASVSLRPVTC